MPAERVIAVSPRKSGTHLLQELMILLGYHTDGEAVPPRAAVVALSLRRRIELARHYMHPIAAAELDHRADRDGFVQATNLLWFQVAELWRAKLAAGNVFHTKLASPELDQPVPMHPEAWGRPFSTTPPGICWTFHSLDIWRMDPAFLREWQSPEGPRVILGYRDPRDTLISMATFLSGEGGHALGRQPEAAVFRPILRSLPTMSERITYLLRDPAVPLLSDFEAAVSLFHHPDVCAVSFEELIGEQGGGSAERQLAAVRRVAEHVGTDMDPEVVVGKVYNRNAYSFHRGRIGTWREVFTAEHHRLFNARFGHLLEIFPFD
ncbi:hypothetical protein AB0K18_35335 [Nonomuraea sp. NPDC049421]|uniref:hypothetical protein n=1 Tax=Nonomuraea sp. NPDC049421 TaxID=3155275 RepID=UPI00342A9AB2